MSSIPEARRKIRAWREYPCQFVWDNFRLDPDEWQKDVLEALGGSANPQRRVNMKACTGPGKSAVLAWIGWHRLSCFAKKDEHPKGAALSITRENLRDNLWAELAKWQNKSNLLTQRFTWTKERVYCNDHPETWFLSARSFSQDADAEAIGRALSGLHSQFPFILLDETGDMPVAVGQKAEQIFTGLPEDALIASAGNPTSTSGLLYHICVREADKWVLITITADPDDPKRTPRVDIDLARQQIQTYGRDNPWVMATILGLFPPAGFNQLLGIEDVEAAMNRVYREEQFTHAAKILGVDVAREGDDRTIFFPRQGLQAFRPSVYRNLRSNIIAGHLSRKEDTWQADGVIVDGTGGWGAGVIDAGETLGRTWLDCQFAGEAFEKERFYNKRAEIWWSLAEWVKTGGAIPRIPELIQELTAPTYTFKGNRILIEPKESIKKRIGKSPDMSDGLALTFAFPIQKRDVVAQMLETMTPGGGDWHPFNGM